MTAPLLTPAEMVFLIGSKFLPLAEITEPRIRAVAGGIKGDGKSLSLASNTVSAALLGLYAEGAVSLKYVEAKKLGMFTSKHVMVARTDRPSDLPAESLDAQLFHAVYTEARTTTKVVDTWFGSRVADPAVRAYGRALERLKACGVLAVVNEDVERGRISAVLTHSATKSVPVLQPVPDMISAVLPQIAQWSERWKSFIADDLTMVQRVYAEVQNVIRYKQEPDDDD